MQFFLSALAVVLIGLLASVWSTIITIAAVLSLKIRDERVGWFYLVYAAAHMAAALLLVQGWPIPMSVSPVLATALQAIHMPIFMAGMAMAGIGEKWRSWKTWWVYPKNYAIILAMSGSGYLLARLLS
jgi:hypothetical protein